MWRRRGRRAQARIIDAADTPGLILDTLTDNVKRLAEGVRRDPNVATEAFRKLGAISLPLAEMVGEKSLGEVTENNRQVIAAAAIDGRIARDPDSVLAKFEQDGYEGSSLPKITLASLRDKAERGSETQRRAQVQAQETERARFLDDLDRRVEAGEAGAGEIAALREAGTLSDDLGARLASRVAFRRAKERRTAESRSRVAAVDRAAPGPVDRKRKGAAVLAPPPR